MARKKPGEKEKLCNAVRAKGAGRCKNKAGMKTDHLGYGRCWRHGGCTPMQTLHAEREHAVLEAKKYGETKDLEPHEAMLLCIRIVAGELDFATKKVLELEESQLLENPVETLQRPLSEGKDGDNPDVIVTETKAAKTQLNVWIQIRHESMDRLVRYSAAALKGGLEERMVKIAEVQGRLIADAIQGILSELGVGNDPRAPQIVRKHMLQISKESTC